MDGAKLRAQLSAAALDHIGDEAGLRRRAKDLLHGALFRGRSIAKERLEAGENGFAVARLLAKVANVVIAALYDFATVHVFRSRNPTAGERFAVVATGGYGRGELAPSSDIDLLFLRAYKQTPWAESVTEYMLYMLWDMSLKVGHASRTIDECIRLAREDHTIQTSLLEVRHIAGDASLVEELRTRFRKEVAERDHAGFIAAKLKEREERHLRAGASRYMVEPNVKEGKGGLRDLHTLFWLARHVYGHEKGVEYVKTGVFTRDEGRRFRRALEFMWSVRCHLHFVTGRAEERLSFDLQPEIAARLGYGQRAGQQAVERFMRHYFLIAKEVGGLTRVLCAKLEERYAKPQSKGLSRLTFANPREAAFSEPGFRLEGGRLSAESPGVLDQALNILRAFAIADARGVDFHPELFGEIGQRLRSIPPLRRDPRANEIFLGIVASKRNPAAALRLMNEAGVLGRFAPEFGRIVAQMQFNMYHHFTVDEHTLRAIEIISRIEHGLEKDEHPLATDIFPKIIQRRALYLAMMFHDTGKGIGDQQVMGEKAARAACERLGLPQEEVDLVGWLVRHHLDMSDTAQKRDIGDPRTVSQFAELVGTVERLRLLLVLTIADIRAVGPGVWNGFKGQLLRDLYGLTEAALKGGRTDEAGVRERLAAQAEAAKAGMRAAMGPEAYSKLAPGADGIEDAYWLSFDSDALIWHAQEVYSALSQRKAVHTAARPRPARGVTEILVLAPDRQGLFASLAAAFAACGADIADARVHTTSQGRAFDIFSVQTVDGRPFGLDDPAALATLLARLQRAAVTDMDLPEAPKPTRRAAAFAIEPWVRLDNDLSPNSTVVEVSGRDRPGLLASLTAVIAEAGFSLTSAHIDAYGARVSDVFYLNEPGGGQIADPARQETLQAKLLDVFKAGEPDAPADPARRRLAVAFSSDAR
ncbi:MAG: [protein-PII] uridylyltransferase [Hyphomonadaceae bacterium]